MQIQKLLAMMSVGAICGAGSLQAQSTDTDIQAKLREATRQKLAELNTKPVTTNSPAPVVPSAPVYTPPPAAPSTKPVYPTTPSPSNPQVYAAPTTPAVPAEPVVPAAPVAPVAPVQVPATPVMVDSSAPQTWPPRTASQEQLSQALEALRQKKAELDSQSPAVAPVYTQPSGVGITATPAPVYAPVPNPVPAPGASSAPVFPTQTASQYVPPATGLSGSKEQRLADLLQQYKTDRITPAEYHQQRAKILSEP